MTPSFNPITNVELFLLGMRTTLEFEALSNYVGALHTSLDLARKQLDEFLEKNLESLPEEQRRHWMVFSVDEDHEHSVMYPAILRSSFLIATYSAFEASLIQARDLLERREGTRPTTSALSKKLSIVERARLDIDAYHPLRAFHAAEWLRVTVDFRRVRNCLVHEAGRLMSSRDAAHIFAFMAANPEYFGVEYGRIRVRRPACEDFVACCQSVLDAVFAELAPPKSAA